MQNILETLLEESFDALTLSSQRMLPRHLRFPKTEEMIKVAIGMRRSGKTYSLYQVINQLLAQGISKQQILFINFEDDRLLPMNAKEMGVLLDAFYTLYPENHDRCCYLFLDAVHNVTDWFLVVRRYFQSKNVQLYLTGSCAKLLSKEIATQLRGRSLSVEVWPYDFKEYLVAHNVPLPKMEGTFGQKTFDVMRQHLLHYFSTGGFPAVQFMSKTEHRETLQNYVDIVILKDIVERYSISNIALLNYLTKTLLTHAASVFSVNKFFNGLKSKGYRVGKDTLKNYLGYLEDAFLIFTVPCYLASPSIQQTRPKKLYVVDNGLVNAFSFNPTQDLRRLLENQVYLDLRRQNKEVYYFNTIEGDEVDFLTVDKAGRRELIQVVWDMSDKKMAEREKRTLLKAQKELGIPGKIITCYEYLKACVAL